MKALKCNNCNSIDLEFKNGFWECNSCGSKFIPDKEEIPKLQEEDKLVAKLKETMEKYYELDDLAPGYLKKVDEIYKKLDVISQQILAINPNNPYALAFEARIIAEHGIKDAWRANYFTEKLENLKEHMTADAKDLKCISKFCFQNPVQDLVLHM